MVINIRVNQSGQSLAEVMVALSISAVVLTALVIVVVNGLRNAQFAQNQVKATKAAQEAIEQVRAIRDRDEVVQSTGGDRKFRAYITNNGLCNSPHCSFKLSSNLSLEEISPSSNDFDPIPNVGSTFERSIRLINNGDEGQKRLRVEVQWTDISGQHSSVLETILSSY